MAESRHTPTFGSRSEQEEYGWGVSWGACASEALQLDHFRIAFTTSDAPRRDAYVLPHNLGDERNDDDKKSKPMEGTGTELRGAGFSGVHSLNASPLDASVNRAISIVLIRWVILSVLHLPQRQSSANKVTLGCIPLVCTSTFNILLLALIRAKQIATSFPNSSPLASQNYDVPVQFKLWIPTISQVGRRSGTTAMLGFLPYQLRPSSDVFTFMLLAQDQHHEEPNTRPSGKQEMHEERMARDQNDAANRERHFRQVFSRVVHCGERELRTTFPPCLTEGAVH
ncbi:hypothetical protein EI94DRAFT_1707849 [Lactarius quietus]|nr:hypothetical protein EI94DRAFT_1707849 [Lactarius quietus]